MTASSFDSTQAVRFDLRHGSVRAGSSGDAVLLVPSAALVALARSAPAEAAEAFGRALGSAIGRRAAARMGDPRAASLEEFVTQLGGELALAGLGVLAFERWGRALVVVVDGSPLGGALLSPVVASALDAATGRKVSCVVLSREQEAARVLVASDRAASRVRAWMASGTAWGDALARLHASSPAGSPAGSPGSGA